MNLVVILGALVIGLTLGLLGSGGSIITMPLLRYVVGEPEKLAIAESLLIVGSIASVGSLLLVRSKLIQARYVVWFGLPSMLGTYFGAWSAQFVSGLVQVFTFSIVMLVSSQMMLKSPVNKAQPANETKHFHVVLVAVAVGMLAGFVGVGGGFLIVPALFLLAGLSLQQATASSLLIIAMQSFSGFLKYAYLFKQQHIDINWPVVLTMVLIGSIGVVAGSKLNKHLAQQQIKKLFALLLVALGLFMLVHSIYQFLNPS